MAMRACLISSSRSANYPDPFSDPGYLLSLYEVYGIEFLKGGSEKIVFIPFALDPKNWRETEIKAEHRFAELGFQMVGISEAWDNIDEQKYLNAADAIFVGGGNTHLLLYTLRRYGLLEIIRRRVLAGMPYGGVSAGAVIAGPGIQTSNDFTIVSVP